MKKKILIIAFLCMIALGAMIISEKTVLVDVGGVEMMIAN